MTTDDRELAFAAKAAGLVWDENWGYIEPGTNRRHTREWNPRDDDGDSMRLAVTIASMHRGASFLVSICKMYDGRGFASAGFLSRDNPTSDAIDLDLNIATRSAIFNAAAEIGRALS